MLDWEMTHLGDPLEDLGWSSMRLWGHDNLAGGLIDRDEYIRLYEQKSGAAVARRERDLALAYEDGEQESITRPQIGE